MVVAELVVLAVLAADRFSLHYGTWYPPRLLNPHRYKPTGSQCAYPQQTKLTLLGTQSNNRIKVNIIFGGAIVLAGRQS